MKNQFTFRQVMMTAVCGILFLSLLIVLMFGQLFMSRVFIAQKQTELIEAFRSINENGLFNTEAVGAIESRNMLVTAVDTNEHTVIYSTRPITDHETERTFLQVVDSAAAALSQSGEEKFYVSSRQDYRDFPSAANVQVNSWLTISGVLDNGTPIMIEAAAQPITEVAQLAVTFYMLVGMAVMALGVVLTFWLSPKLSDPLKEMSRAAKRMANQDFSIQCPTRVAVDEFSELGVSINRMSEEMQRYVTDLQQANESLTRDINEKDRLEQARKTLFSNISHDLKTPIAIISGYAEGLKSGMVKTEDEIIEYCDIISDEADRMQSLIVRLLELNRLESGSIPLEYEAFDICDTLEYLLGTFSLYAAQRGIGIQKDFGESMYVYSDYTSVEQTLTNIIQNAISHNIENGTIRISAALARDKVRLSFYNTCEPIDAEELPKLWDGFYRLDKSRTRSGGESGLGLAIVKGNMELLGMPYGVRLDKGGIVFWLELPYAPPSDQSQAL